MKRRRGKLVRDNIPNIIRANNEIPNVRVMNTDEYHRELLYKLIEEAQEVCQAGRNPQSVEFIAEIADLREVLDTVVSEFGVSTDLIEKVKADKRTKRGGFNEKFFLESVQ